MSTQYSPGCKDEKSHQCDMCEADDGRPTLYWPDKDFDLCYLCLSELHQEHGSKEEKQIIMVRRAVISEETRNAVYEQDGYKCRQCGSTERLTVDHIIPFSKGGKTEYDNFQTLCFICNVKKGNR